MKERPDQMELELVLQSQVGNASAFEGLVRLHFKGVFRLCRRFAKNDAEAEDLTQDCFVNCHRALKSVTGKNFKAWLYRIAVNLCRSNLRKRYREDRKLNKLKAERGGEEPSAQPPSVEQLEMRELVAREIETLPERQREVLNMHLNGSLSHDEIARALGITYDDVKTNLSIARKKLTQALSRFLKE
ncbi:MAG TPA: RNA polymerase sigma factor [Planctomycetota bacterium]|nr:RNA polymerase sigma factor [Planctomycetota bacterium]